MTPPAPGKVRYGFTWPELCHDIDIEFEMIRRGGQWKTAKGTVVGSGLFEHYMNARKLLWPERYRHRWTDLLYHNFIENTVTIMLGCGASQKTSHASEFCLINYWLWPEETLVIVSTNTLDKLQMGVFGELKMLWKNARKYWPHLAGHCVDYKHLIATDDVPANDDREESEARDIRRGIKGLACYQGRQWVGLGVYSGISQVRILFLADELQFMAPTYMECPPNMMQHSEYLKVIVSGNPNHDPLDCLARAGEPKLGWDPIGEVKKTTVWENKFENGKTVNLIWTDSPNFDYPESEPTHFKGMVSRKTAKSVETFWGKDSLQYSKQCIGAMRIGMIGNRVVTIQLCRQHHALELARWEGSPRQKIYALDPAWGGPNADRCVGGWGEFGISDTGQQILRLNPPVIVPIDPASPTEADDQIALFVKKQTESIGIAPEDIFYDSTGRGTVGSAFARVFGLRVPVPIAFGDRPSTRPVRHDLFKIDWDGARRLVPCDEHYSKFVTELWFSFRYIIECDQLRELPEEVMMEFCMREYRLVAGNKIEVEKKEDTIERLGQSPDLADWAAILAEGARQRGFKIQRLGISFTDTIQNDTNLEESENEWRENIQSRLLLHR